jgi:hypothetical protein
VPFDSRTIISEGPKSPITRAVPSSVSIESNPTESLAGLRAPSAAPFVHVPVAIAGKVHLSVFNDARRSLIVGFACTPPGSATGTTPTSAMKNVTKNAAKKMSMNVRELDRTERSTS